MVPCGGSVKGNVKHYCMGDYMVLYGRHKLQNGGKLGISIEFDSNELALLMGNSLSGGVLSTIWLATRWPPVWF